jgi:hypothetical protein
MSTLEASSAPPRLAQQTGRPAGVTIVTGALDVRA